MEGVENGLVIVGLLLIVLFLLLAFMIWTGNR